MIELTMYNLFVSADENSWEGPPFLLDISRCIREYTEKDIAEKYQELTEVKIKEIKRFPCLFAYESPCQKSPKIGFIRKVIKRRNLVSIEYEIVDIDPFLTYHDLDELSFRLDIRGLELHRTHWAIKNINLAEELYVKGIIFPQGMTRDSKTIDITKHVFDVSLSFPGDVRDYVEAVAVHLERIIGINSYFYDKNYRAQLARPSLDVLLQEIYSKRSKLVVVFLGEKYQEKKWCGVEFRAIKEVLFDNQLEKIMYIRMDEGKVNGVFSTDGYIDATKHSPEEIAHFIIERIGVKN